MSKSLKETLAQKNTLPEILSPVNEELVALEKTLLKSVSTQNNILNNISTYIIKAGGKRLRPALSFLVAKALNNGFVTSNHLHIGTALELIHTATLIHDDVIDEADTRRGKETVNRIWNSKTAIIAGDFLLSKSLIELAVVKDSAVMEIFANIMCEICEGEIQQDVQGGEQITIEDYVEKSRRKTAMLFVAGCESAAVISPDSNNFTTNAIRNYALNFGTAFQIIDDISSYTLDSKALGKPTDTDFKNGILTAPIIFALEEYDKTGDKKLYNIVNKENFDINDYQIVTELIKQSQSIEKSYKLALSYAKKAIDSIENMPESVYKDALVRIVKYTVRNPS